MKDTLDIEDQLSKAVCIIECVIAAAENVDESKLKNALTWTLRLAVDEIEAVGAKLEAIRVGEGAEDVGSLKP